METRIRPKAEKACGPTENPCKEPGDNWIHRSDGMRCRACMYFARKAGLIGRCRRHAPTMSGFPVVFESDWCGDHKLDETKF